MLDSIQGIHIEPTNMCTLKCPKCARTEFISQFPKAWTNKNLNLDSLKQFLDIDLSDKRIYLCGNYGDPIYYDQLFDMIDYFKLSGSNIVISTNGSYRTQLWWEQLADKLDSNDTIVFGIDGTPENFTNYRVNADWESIKIALEVLGKTQISTIWQYIPFSFNENTIDQARTIAEQYHVTEFAVWPSYRWDSEDDPLKPINYNHTADKSSSIITWSDSTRSNDIDAICKQNNREHYISAEGYYMPCCYVGDHRFYYKSEFYKNRELLSISNTTLSQILSSSYSIDFYNSIEDAKLNYCTYNCPKL